MSSDELVKVKGAVGADGASLDVRVGRELPGVIASLFPTASARRRAKQLVSGVVLQKIANGEALDPADLEYVQDVFGEAEAKWARRKAIADRASRALEEEPSVAALPQGKADVEGERPAEDWLNRFWDDASLVSDEVLQEIYARILASEAVSPGACSSRTLRVLRYLDKGTADTFARVAAAAVGDFLPNDDEILAACGLSYGLVLDLDDAGLVESGSMLSRKFAPKEATFLRWGNRVIMLSSPSAFSIPMYPLTRAGRELARVAQVQFDEEHFFRVLRWLRNRRGDTRLAWANMPSRSWQGSAEQLFWTDVPMTKSDAG